MELFTCRRCAAVLLAMAPLAPTPVHAAPPTFLLGGIQVNEADHQAWFDALRQESMNTVQVTDYARQGDWDSDNLWWDAEAPWAVREIQGARKNGLAVVFVARVALDHAFPRNAFLWHGMIQPKSEAALAAWFERYTRFVVGWATICQREGVEVFMIGSEMNALATTLPTRELPGLEAYFLDADKQTQRQRATLDHQREIEERQLWMRDRERYPSPEAYLAARSATEASWAEQVTGSRSLTEINRRRALLQDHWTRLIAAVRRVYRGKIGYAANFDQYRQVGFWPQLDLMGINAYFKLRDRLLAPDQRGQLDSLLLAGWRSVFSEIVDFRARHELRQPVIFTELGYTWRAESTLEPWADTGYSLLELPTRLADGRPGPPERKVMVWRDQPQDLAERAAAVRALEAAHRELAQPLLGGILYWKLSSHAYHQKDESFMVKIGGPSDDPVLPELRRFLRP